MAYVFVYGSLRRGSYNNGLMGMSRLMGTTFTSKSYLLMDGSFPRLVETGTLRQTNRQSYAGKVVGEVYEVDDATLRRLDRLEGHPDFYVRKVIDVDLPVDGKVQAYIWPHGVDTHYEWVKPVDGLLSWPVKEGPL